MVYREGLTEAVNYITRGGGDASNQIHIESHSTRIWSKTITGTIGFSAIGFSAPTKKKGQVLYYCFNIV